MGAVPAKYFYPPVPYGSSEAVNAVTKVQPQGLNPQTPLLPPNFTDPGTTIRSGGQRPAQTNGYNLGPGSSYGGATFDGMRYRPYGYMDYL